MGMISKSVKNDGTAIAHQWQNGFTVSNQYISKSYFFNSTFYRGHDKHAVSLALRKPAIRMRRPGETFIFCFYDLNFLIIKLRNSISIKLFSYHATDFF
jgi:hypothetical protein